MRLPNFVAIPLLSAQLVVNAAERWRIRRNIRKLEDQLSRSERARFGRSLTDDERRAYYR